MSVSNDWFQPPAPAGRSRVTHVAAAIATSVGLMVLAGWALGIEPLKRVFPGLASMKANTALCFALLGIALHQLSLPPRGPSRSHRSAHDLARIAVVFVIATALASFGEDLFRWNLGIDQLLFRDWPLDAHTVHPGRMAPATAINLALLGLALLGLDRTGRRARGISEGLSVVVVSGGLLACVGYLYSVEALYRVQAYTSMSPTTAVSFVVLGLGTLFARPDRAVMSEFASRHGGGLMSRRILPVAILLPLGIGWLRLAGQRAGFYGTEFGLALFTTTTIASFAVLVWFTARLLNRMDAQRHASSVRLRESEERLRLLIDGVTDCAIYMLDPAGHVMTWNSGAERLKGYAADEILGRSLTCFYTPEELAEGYADRALATARDEGHCTDEGWRVRKDGSRFWASVALTALRNARGELVGFAKLTRDLTERRNAEQALRESEERFRLMANSAPVLLWVAGLDKRCTFFNKTWLDFTGRTMEQEVGDGWAEGVHADDLGACLATYVAAFDARRPFDMEYRLRRHDGEYRWIQDRGVPRFSASGEFSGYIGSCIDVTDAKRSSEELRDSQLRLAGLVDSAMDGILTVDSAQKIILFNPAAERMFGYRAAECVGRPLSMLLPERFAAAHAGHVRQFGQTGVSSRRMGALGSISGRRSSGEEFPIEASISHMEVRGQKFFTVILRDVTERLRAETALRESQAALGLTLDAAQIGHWDLDLVTHTASRSIQHDRVFGYSQLLPEWTYEKFLEHVHRDDRERVDRAFQAGVAARTEWDFECRIHRRDGALRWIWAHGNVFTNAAGDPIRMLGMVTDITARKQAEEEIRQLNVGLEQRVQERTRELEAARRQAETADRFKSEFLANMSHELRTPLNGIIGFSEVLVDGKAGPLNPTQEEFLGDILNSGTHLLQLINDVLDLAKVEAGRLEVHNETFSLAAAIRDVCSVTRALVLKKRLQVEVVTDPAGDEVRLDQRMVKQVLYNLLSNAIKFTDAEGRVMIRTAAVDGDRVELSVRDSGIGIRAEDLPRLFREFEQLDAGSARRYQGTGLGLALTRKLVELQGGRIDVHSEHGIGSTFTVILPRVPVASEVPGPAHSA